MTITKSQLVSRLAIGLLLTAGVLCIMLPVLVHVPDAQTGKTVNDILQVVLKCADSLAGALIGAGAALAASRVLNQEEELLSLVAAGSMTQSSVQESIVKEFQRKFVMYHTTRHDRGIVGLSRGFHWRKASVDLSAPAPGMLLGTCTWDDQTYIVEGYVRHKLLVLHVIAHPDQEIIESAFLFPLGNRRLPAYGSGYHMTEAGLTDLALSPAILCVDDKDVNEDLPSGGTPLPLGIVSNPKKQYLLDNAWWNKHRMKILPRIFPQISATYASVGNIDGEWLFRYVLIYEHAHAPVDLLMDIRKSGARYLITPGEKPTPAAPSSGVPAGHAPDGSVEWMAEMRALQPECMSGRWWGLPHNPRTGPAPDYEEMGVQSTEGTLLLNIDTNDRGMLGIFVARSGSSPHVLGVIAGVRHIDGVDPFQKLARLFKRACSNAENASQSLRATT